MPSSIIYTGAVIFNNHFSFNVSTFFLNLSGRGSMEMSVTYYVTKNRLKLRKSLVNFDFSG